MIAEAIYANHRICYPMIVGGMGTANVVMHPLGCD